MKTKILSPEEREVQGKKLDKFLRALLGIKGNKGMIQKASLTIEVNEPITIEMKILL